MKTVVITFLTFFVSGVQAQFNELTSNSEIKSVTVFMNGAQVNREASVSLAKGFNRVQFDDLSPFINSSSIQVNGFKGITIVSVNHRVDYLADEKNTTFSKLLKDRDNLVFDREKVRNRIRNLKKERQFIFANQNIKSKVKGVGVEDIMDMSDFYRERLPDINNRLKEYTIQEKAFTERINKLNRQLIEIQDEQSKSRGIVEVTIKADRAISGTMKFNYVVRNAGWYPTYDIRSAQLGEEIDLTYKAMVYQKTGSDWANVELSLSTGDPNKGSTPPVAQPWRISYTYQNQKRYDQYSQNQTYQWNNYSFENAPVSYDAESYSAIGDTMYNVEPRYKTSQPVGFDEYGSPIYQPEEIDAFGGMVLEKLNKEDVAKMPARNAMTGAYSVVLGNNRNSTADNTSMQETSVNTVFDIEIPYSIPSDGDEYTVEVQSFKVPAVYEYYSAPRSDQDAFLVAKAVNWDAMNILPGNSSIYFQNTYVGDAFINPNITEDTLELSLGRDKSIVVERKLIKEFSKKINIGSKRKTMRGYSLKVRNNRSKPIRLILIDQIPVSSDKDIEVELLQQDGAVLNEENGKLQWILDIQPGETKTVNFRFEVKYPKEYSLPSL